MSSSGLDSYSLRRPDGRLLYRSLFPACREDEGSPLEAFRLPSQLRPWGEVELFKNGELWSRGNWPHLKRVRPAARPAAISV